MMYLALTRAISLVHVEAVIKASVIGRLYYFHFRIAYGAKLLYSFCMNKTCSRCKLEKPVTDFPKRKLSKDGLNYHCKSCSNLKAKEWYQRNLEKSKAAMRIWRKNNSKKCSEYSRNWFAEHPGIRSKYQKDRVERLKTEKRCTVCGQPLLANSDLYCLRHYIWTTASRRLGSCSETTYSNLLAMWEAQQGKCYYSGVSLVLGVNACLDHILPVSKFPARGSDITNVVWADRDVNLAKRALSKEEFLQLCQKVVTHNSQIQEK